MDITEHRRLYHITRPCLRVRRGLLQWWQPRRQGRDMTGRQKDMKSVDPKKQYEYRPEWAPEVTVFFVQPHGTTIPMNGIGGFMDLYLDKFVAGIDGLEIPDENKKLPWSHLMPVRLANEVFTEISRISHLEDTEKEG